MSSAPGPVAAATTQHVAPPAPASLAAEALSGRRIRLKWQNVAGETGYVLERSADGVRFSVLASLDDETASFVDAGLSANARYFYRVRAVNGPAGSGYSPVAAARSTA